MAAVLRQPTFVATGQLIDLEDLAAKSGVEQIHRDNQPETGNPLELEWLRDLDADGARQVLMNFAGLSSAIPMRSQSLSQASA